MIVDLGSPEARVAFAGWLSLHESRLRGLAAATAAWAAESRERERRRAARRGLPARPLAVVFDVDEVLLCNVHCSGLGTGDVPGGDVPGGGAAGSRALDYFGAAECGRGDSGWAAACVSGEPPSPAYPGAREALAAASAAGLAVFFVSGRREWLRGETVCNLRLAGLADVGVGGDGRVDIAAQISCADFGTAGSDGGPLRPQGGQLILRPDDDPGASVRAYKARARRGVALTHRIAINVGDQLSDLGRPGDVQVYLPHYMYVTP